MGNPRQKRVAIAIVLSTLGATAFFVAQGSTTLLAASLLELDRSAALTGPVAARGPSTTPVRERRDDTQILRRNIFDSEQGPLDGVPVEEVAETRIDHLPYRCWCEHCARGRGTGEQQSQWS